MTAGGTCRLRHT